MDTTSARFAYERDDPLWPRQIVRDLESSEAGSALEWAYRCTRLVLEQHTEQRFNELVVEFDESRMEGANAESIAERSEEIWHRPNRDRIQTAIARIFMALALFLKRDEKGYAFEVEATMVNLADEECCSPETFDAFLEIASSLE